MKILLVGAGGYASGYVTSLLECKDPAVICEGIVDPYYETCAQKDSIDEAGIPVYDTMEAFYASHSADLAIICTPPFLHCEQSIFALAHGSYVLCEKPVAPTVEQAEAMLEAERRYGRWIAIGYQWSYSDAIQTLKKDVLNGNLGKPISFKTAVSWPRNRAYYKRGGGWGGRISKDGITVLDSIASNACAHYLHNMFFLLGDTMRTSAEVDSLTGTCLCANDIENFDTCSLQMKTQDGAELYFIASHAAKHNRNPEFVYRFEKATVFFAEDDGSVIRAVFGDKTEKCYGNPFQSIWKKLWDCVDAIRTGSTPICTVATALAHTKLIGRIYRECPIHRFPKERIRINGDTDGIYVEGLFEALYEAYAQKRLLSDVLGIGK